MRPTGARGRGACGRRAWAAAALVAGLAWASPARAQGTGGKVAAEALFEEGRKLVAAGNFADACPKFASSQRLDPSPGTLLNLASCYEKLGRSATAWATYREAASAANAAGRAEYVATAQRHADALVPKLAHATVTVAQPVDGLQVTRDGNRVDRGEWGLTVPIDAGQHTIEASAPAHKPWTSTVDVPQDGANVSVTIPALEALPVEPAPPPPVAGPPGAGANGAAGGVGGPGVVPGGGDAAGSVGHGQRVVGVVIGSMGIAGLAVASVFSVIAKNKYNDSLGNCAQSDPNRCNQDGVNQRNDARDAGNVASVAVSVGAAALLGGVVVWLTAPQAPSGAASASASLASSASASSLRVGIAPTLGGAVLQGTW
jgi:hypothetical protein